MFRLADGAHWNPGSGRREYWYDQEAARWNANLSVPAGSPLTVPDGGTGLTSGTSGGILAFSGATTLVSSGLLSAGRLVLGGGAGVAPSTPLTLGVSTQVLHGNAAGAPTWGAVALTTDVSGILPMANGGSNAALTAANGGVVYSSASALAILAPNAGSGFPLLSGGAAAPTWGVVAYPGALSLGDVVVGGGTNSFGRLTIAASGKVLQSNGISPVWSAAGFPIAAGATGTVLRSDGTNWAATTATYPNTVTANQLLLGTASNVVGGSANLTFDGTGTLFVGDGTTGKIQLGGATASFPMLRRNGTFTDARLADDSAYAGLRFSTAVTNGFNLQTDIGLGTTIGAVAADSAGVNIRTTATSGNFTIGNSSTSNTAGAVFIQGGGKNQIKLAGTGQVSIGGNANASTGTAWLHLPAGTTAASTAPLKFTSGSLQATAEAGAVEFLTDKAYLTITTGVVRKELSLNDSSLTSGSLIEATTNGRLQNATTTGTGSAVRATTPTLVTPVLGAATATSLRVAGAATGATLDVTGTGAFSGALQVNADGICLQNLSAVSNNKVVQLQNSFGSASIYLGMTSAANYVSTASDGDFFVRNDLAAGITFSAGVSGASHQLRVDSTGLQFGSYTASALAVTGYIPVKDLGGVTRRLLVG
jgi:hypothetical protein